MATTFRILVRIFHLCSKIAWQLSSIADQYKKNIINRLGIIFLAPDIYFESMPVRPLLQLNLKVLKSTKMFVKIWIGDEYFLHVTVGPK